MPRFQLTYIHTLANFFSLSLAYRPGSTLALHIKRTGYETQSLSNLLKIAVWIWSSMRILVFSLVERVHGRAWRLALETPPFFGTGT